MHSRPPSMLPYSAAPYKATSYEEHPLPKAAKQSRLDTAEQHSTLTRTPESGAGPTPSDVTLLTIDKHWQQAGQP